MSKKINYLLLFLLFGLLIAIRWFENQVFYDPYLAFFKNDYLYMDSPKVDVFKVTVFTSLRYFLNSIISLGILYVIFKDKHLITFSAIIYLIAFVVLIAGYFYFIFHPKQEYYYLFFNLRRFLIQPILLIILLPAFYYQKMKN